MEGDGAFTAFTSAAFSSLVTVPAPTAITDSDPNTPVLDEDFRDFVASGPHDFFFDHDTWAMTMAATRPALLVTDMPTSAPPLSLPLLPYEDTVYTPMTPPQRDSMPLGNTINQQDVGVFATMTATVPIEPQGSLSPITTNSSPISPSNDGSSSATGLLGGRTKRKQEDMADDDAADEEAPAGKKTNHNMIERRYRNNLNDKIAMLRDAVPSLRVADRRRRGGHGKVAGAAGVRSSRSAAGPAHGTRRDDQDLDGLAPASKLNKATVLSKATEYIRHLEKQNIRLQEEVNANRTRIGAFEKLFAAGASSSPPVRLSPYEFPDELANGVLCTMPEPGGMIHVPEEVRRLQQPMVKRSHSYTAPIDSMRHTPSQPTNLLPQHMNPQQAHPEHSRPQQLVPQHIHPEQPHLQHPYSNVPMPRHRGQPGAWHNGMIGKLMVGSLAGLMVMEGLSEQDQAQDTPAARGLFALPTDLFRRVWYSFMPSRHWHISQDIDSNLPGLKGLRFMLVLGIVLYAFLPSLFSRNSDKSNRKVASSTILQAPRPASSKHLRQQAWLTSIQTVWVPRHNFFLEAAALLLKMAKLSLRNMIGPEYYALITGTTDSQEAARVKAWTIALDALLTGGDLEVSNSRLLLTLLASATLPKTPTHLMLQALHLRILLWGVGQAGLDRFQLFHKFSQRLARWKWDEARVPHAQMISANDPTACEASSHLIALLQCPCDEVLSDVIIQRAYNLVWGIPSAQHASANVDGMDDVVEDPAIRSPLDAVAAWYATLTTHKVLINTLQGDSPHLISFAPQAMDLITTAVPIGSIAQARALVARAALDPSKRGLHMAKALQMLAPSSGKHGFAPSLIASHNAALTNANISVAMKCAIAMAHLDRSRTRKQGMTPTLKQVLETCSEQVQALARARRLDTLGLAAAHVLLRSLSGFDSISTRTEEMSVIGERLAAVLRLWTGGRAADRHGIPGSLRCKLIDEYLEILMGDEAALPVGGHDHAACNDDGYGSMSDMEADVGMRDGGKAGMRVEEGALMTVDVGS